VLLVVARSPIVLEPVDEHLERLVVVFMEIESFRAHFDELFENFVFCHVAEDNMLRVGRQDCEAIRDARRLLLLFFLESLLKIFKCLSVGEFLVANDFTHESIARNDVALHNFTQTFKVEVVAYN